MDPFNTIIKCTVTCQPDGTVLKSGPRVRMGEAEALKLAHSLGLPVPAVHQVRTVTEEHVEISMDFVQGDVLEAVWPSMTEAEKLQIAQQLGQMISLLRSASQSQFHIGSCGGPAFDCRRRLEYSGGPFDIESDFNHFLLDLYKATPNAIRKALRDSLRTDHRITFTHGDLSPRNIIVSKGCITGLLDWEFSGWYPEYWEYVKFFECVTDCKDWRNFADTIFDMPYPAELVTYQALVRWQLP